MLADLLFLQEVDIDGAFQLGEQAILRLDFVWMMLVLQGLARPSLSLKPALMAFQYMAIDRNYN